MWVFVRTSANFAHLTSFQAIEFMDWPVPKTLDISVCQTSQNAAFCNCCSSVVHGEEREHDLISSPVSTFSARTPSTMTTITTWEEMKVRVRRIHWERLKDDIKLTSMKGKWCSFLIWCLHSWVISRLNLYLSIEVR